MTVEAGLRECDGSMRRTILSQIRPMDLLATSGGRVIGTETGLILPVGHGYKVVIDLQGNDTYRVQRVFVRGTRVFPKGEVKDVYCEELSETVYRAGCYVNVAFGDHNPNA